MDIALAEFNGLRAEIVSRATAQSATLGLGLTAIGLVFGFAVKNRAGGDELLAVPPLALFLNLIYSAETFRIISIGEYIRTELWPYLERQAGQLPSWEQRVAAIRRRKSTVAMALLLDAPAFAIFVGSSVVALVAAHGDTKQDLWILDAGLTILAAVLPAAIGLAARATAATGQ